MPTHDLPADTWFEQAVQDLRAAEHLLGGGYAPHATVLAHLAVEKALKGLFRERAGATPPPTHNLRYLVKRLRLDLGVDGWSHNLQDALDGLSDVTLLFLYAPDRPFGHPVSDRMDAARERVAHAQVLVQWMQSKSGSRPGPDG
jgi:hypothetical protein